MYPSVCVELVSISIGVQPLRANDGEGDGTEAFFTLPSEAHNGGLLSVGGLLSLRAVAAAPDDDVEDEEVVAIECWKLCGAVVHGECSGLVADPDLLCPLCK